MSEPQLGDSAKENDQEKSADPKNEVKTSSNSPEKQDKDKTAQHKQNRRASEDVRIHSNRQRIYYNQKQFVNFIFLIKSLYFHSNNHYLLLKNAMILQQVECKVSLRAIPIIEEVVGHLISPADHGSRRRVLFRLIQHLLLQN